MFTYNMVIWFPQLLLYKGVIVGPYLSFQCVTTAFIPIIHNLVEIHPLIRPRQKLHRKHKEQKMATQDSSNTSSKPEAQPRPKTPTGPSSTTDGGDRASDRSAPNSPGASGKSPRKSVDSGRAPRETENSQTCSLCDRQIPAHGVFCPLFPHPL